MNSKYIRTKLPTCIQTDSDAPFKGLSSDDAELGYRLEVRNDLSFVFESESRQSTYYADSEAELVVAARECIKEFDSNSRSSLPTFGGKKFDWNSGPVSIVATDFGGGLYKIFRANKMVGSQTEISGMKSHHNVFRKVGMYPQTDMDFVLVEDALYVFLANFESTRIEKTALRDSVKWCWQIISGFEGRQIKLPHKLDTKHSGMLARQVKIFYEGKELKGVLLAISMGLKAEVITEEFGNVWVYKTDIWI